MTYFNNAKLATFSKVVSLMMVSGMFLGCSDKKSPSVKNGNNSTFYVESVSQVGGFTVVGEPNAQGQYNQKLLTLEACVKDVAGTNSVSDLKFNVTAGNVTSSKITDPKGCFQWSELIEFNLNERAKNVFMGRTIEAVEKHSGKESVGISVNPWDDKFAFNKLNSASQAQAASLEQGPVAYKTKELAAKANVNYNYDLYVQISDNLGNGILSPYKTQTEIDTFKLNYNTVDYYNLKLDKSLNITLPYHYTTEFSIDILKQTLGDVTTEKIKMGNFKFYLLFLKESQDISNPQPSDVVAAVQFSGKPYGKERTIKETIKVEFNNIAALTNRMNILLTIASADEPSLFLDQNYQGNVNTVTTNNNLEIQLRKSSVVAKTLLENYLLAKEENEKATADVKSLLQVQGFKQLKNLSVNFKRNEAWYAKIDPANWHKSSNISLDLSPTLIGLTEKNALLDDEKKALCALFFNEVKDFETKSFFKNCVMDPSSYLRASLKETILTNPKIVGAPIASRHQSLKYTATMEYTTADVVSSGHSYGGSVDGSVAAGTGKNKSFDLSIPFVPLKVPAVNFSSTLNVGMNGKIYALNSFEKNQKTSVGVTSEVAEELSITSFAISFNAKVQKCLLITPVADKISSYKDYFQYSNLEVPNGKFYCLNPENRDIVRTENYYLINKTVMKESNSFFDIYSSAINPMRFVVRGQKSFSMLKDLLTSAEGYKIKFIPFSNPFTKDLPQSKLIDDPSLYMSQDDYRFISGSNIDLLN